MLYDQYFIDDLKARADLVRIIRPYAQDLKKKGQNWMACCPFHQEKTPSFSVNPSKGFYKCFGCGKGGTAFNFLMEMEGLNFPEAVRRVAEISGVMLPEPVDDASYERSKRQREEKKQLADQIIELNQIALEYWENELKVKSKPAKAAREYLEKRGISADIQKQFRIGYSPDKWDALIAVLRDFGANEKLIAQSGLVSVNEEKDRIFDRFRGRIMFPVLDVNGRPVAFGARAMGSDEPKYLNSPETPAYVKGEHLYGLFQAKDEIRRRKFAILVEGYLDLIALVQFGVTNVAASLGTAFTPEQAKLLNQFARQVVINYDGDRPGIEAARKAVLGLLGRTIEAKVFVLPNGADPDDFIRENGADEYELQRSKAQWWYDFFSDPRVLGHGMSTPRNRAEAAEQLLRLVRAIPNLTERSTMFEQVMKLCSINGQAAQRELWRSIASASTARTNALDRDDDVEKAVRRIVRPKITIAERRLLELLVFDRELRDLIFPQLEPSDHENLATAELFAAFIAIHTEKADISPETLMDHIADDEAMLSLAQQLLAGSPRRDPGEAPDNVLHDAENCVFSLRNMAIANRIHQISREAALAEAEGDNDLASKLSMEQIELEKIRRDMQWRTANM